MTTLRFFSKISLTERILPYDLLILLSFLMLYQNLVLAVTSSLAKTLIWRISGLVSATIGSLAAETTYCLTYECTIILEYKLLFMNVIHLKLMPMIFCSFFKIILLQCKSFIQQFLIWAGINGFRCGLKDKSHLFILKELCSLRYLKS